MQAHRVVVIGGGFGGLQAVLKLRRAPVEVTLVDRRNFHLFQPLTYQVATGGLSPGEIAYPLRAIFKRNRNIRVLMGEVEGIDLAARELQLRPVAGVPAPSTLRYDSLIVAGGSQYAYFGHEEWREHAAEDRVLTAFPASLSAKAARSLERLGVTVLVERTVVAVDRDGVMIEDSRGTQERIRSRTVVWAAGVTASGLAAKLSELTGAER